MRDDKWGGQNLEAQNATAGGVEELHAKHRSNAFPLQLPRDVPEHLDQVGPRAAARVEHNDFLVRKASLAAEFFAEDSVNLADLVSNDLLRGIPDPEFLPQVWIKRLKEGL